MFLSGPTTKVLEALYEIVMGDESGHGIEQSFSDGNEYFFNEKTIGGIRITVDHATSRHGNGYLTFTGQIAGGLQRWIVRRDRNGSLQIPNKDAHVRMISDLTDFIDFGELYVPA